jgi:hypothetical protein
MQKRFAPNSITASGRWVLATSLGMGIPFVFVVIANEFWGTIPVALPVIVATGGLMTGLLQLPNVRRHSTRSGWWVPASIVGWAVAWLPTAFGGGVGMLVSGALLGAVTGGAIVWLLQHPYATEQSVCEAS